MTPIHRRNLALALLAWLAVGSVVWACAACAGSSIVLHGAKADLHTSEVTLESGPKPELPPLDIDIILEPAHANPDLSADPVPASGGCWSATESPR